MRHVRSLFLIAAFSFVLIRGASAQVDLGGELEEQWV